MVWRRSGDKPLSEPIMFYLTDAYMRHSASMSQRIDCSSKADILSYQLKYFHLEAEISNLQIQNMISFNRFGGH